MKLTSTFPIAIALTFFALHTLIALNWDRSPSETRSTDRVVLNAPLLTILHGGDRFLAANLESFRLTSTAFDRGRLDLDYTLRAQEIISQLNSCHEQNYYLANSLLPWSGANKNADAILERAIECRHWDELPPFFHGFNQYFFGRDIESAQQYLAVAANRATDNAAVFKKFSVMIKAESFDDAQIALDYLIKERDAAKDPKLAEMIDKRVTRMDGLVKLREAKREYEAEHGQLDRLEDLALMGFLPSVPQDPLGLGYELEGGKVMLKTLKIVGAD